MLHTLLGTAVFASGAAVLVNSGAHFDAGRMRTAWLQIPLGLSLFAAALVWVILAH